MARKPSKRSPTKVQQLEEMLPKGYTFATWSPGDGQTRYRFFHNAPANQTYSGPRNGIFTALGFKEALAYAAGLAR